MTAMSFTSHGLEPVIVAIFKVRVVQFYFTGFIVQ